VAILIFSAIANIILDSEFMNCNVIFKAQCVQMKKLGLCKVNHHPPICEEDLELLNNSQAFSLDDPISLQRKVFFDLMLHFSRRGGENLRKLTKSHFILKTITALITLKKYKDELTKNHREHHENEESAVMIGNRKNELSC
jgi:hypothetical protein